MATPLTMVPATLVLYDYVIVLDEEVEYIWNKPKSIVTLIYLVLRYVGTIAVLFYTGVLLWYWNTSDKL